MKVFWTHVLLLAQHLNLSPFRLIPILVNGMKYSEIDIILLKVSTHLLLSAEGFCPVYGLSMGMTISSVLRLYDVSCIHTVWPRGLMSAVHCLISVFVVKEPFLCCTILSRPLSITANVILLCGWKVWFLLTRLSCIAGSFVGKWTCS